MGGIPPGPLGTGPEGGVVPPPPPTLVGPPVLEVGGFAPPLEEDGVPAGRDPEEDFGAAGLGVGSRDISLPRLSFQKAVIMSVVAKDLASNAWARSFAVYRSG